MDAAQVLLIVVISVLTFLLLLLGIQVFLILKQLKKTVDKVNKVLDDTGVISESIATPVANLSSIIGSLKTGMSLLNLLKRKKKHTTEGEEEDGEGA